MLPYLWAERTKQRNRPKPRQSLPTTTLPSGRRSGTRTLCEVPVCPWEPGNNRVARLLQWDEGHYSLHHGPCVSGRVTGPAHLTRPQPLPLSQLRHAALLFSFLNYIYLLICFLCECVCVRARTHVCMCVGQTTACGNYFSPSTI